MCGGGGRDVGPAPAEFSCRTAEEELLTHTASSRAELVTGQRDYRGEKQRETEREGETGVALTRKSPQQPITTAEENHSWNKSVQSPGSRALTSEQQQNPILVLMRPLQVI